MCHQDIAPEWQSPYMGFKDQWKLFKMILFQPEYYPVTSKDNMYFHSKELLSTPNSFKALVLMKCLENRAIIMNLHSFLSLDKTIGFLIYLAYGSLGIP